MFDQEPRFTPITHQPDQPTQTFFTQRAEQVTQGWPGGRTRTPGSSFLLCLLASVWVEVTPNALLVCSVCTAACLPHFCLKNSHGDERDSFIWLKKDS